MGSLKFCSIYIPRKMFRGGGGGGGIYCYANFCIFLGPKNFFFGGGLAASGGSPVEERHVR